MLKRALSALVGIAIFLALCFGGLLPFAIGATVIAALATYEWVTAYQRADKMEAKAGDKPRIPRWVNAVNVILAGIGVACPLIVYWNFDVHLYSPASISWLNYYCAEMIYLSAAPGPKNSFRLNDDYNWTVYVSPTFTAILLISIGLLTVLLAKAALTGKAFGSLRQVYGFIGFIYIGIFMSSLVLLRALTGPLRPIPASMRVPNVHFMASVGGYMWGAWLMLLVAVCVWMTDTGAYLVGRKWGRHKLAPALSPNKTVEGSVGGLALAVITGVCFGLWIHLPWQHGLAVGLIAGVMGQLGDLFESALKREIGIKDFGGIMPGHGGALDRFDSLLFVTPLAFCYLHFVAKL